MEVCIFPTLLSVLVIPRHLWEVEEPSGHVAELELPSSLTLGGILEEQSQELGQGCSAWVPKEQGTRAVPLSVLGRGEAQHTRYHELGVMQLLLHLPWNQPHF